MFQRCADFASSDESSSCKGSFIDLVRIGLVDHITINVKTKLCPNVNIDKLKALTKGKKVQNSHANLI